jgi:hypothetical protein
MDKWLKGSFAVAALLAGAGVFYHFVFFLPAAERAQRKPPQASAAHDQCRQAAQLLYDVTWASACMTVAIQQQQRHAECMKDEATALDPSRGRSQCDQQFGHADGSSECSLPNAHAAMVNAALKEAEDRCATETRRANAQ